MGDPSERLVKSLSSVIGGRCPYAQMTLPERTK